MSIDLPRVQGRRVFLDSSGFLALANADDPSHEAMKATMNRFRDERWWLFTSNFVIAETHALFLARLGQRQATDFLRDVAPNSATVIRTSLKDESRARDIIIQYDDKRFSYTDATSFAIMERLRIGTALTLDAHFAQFGFTVFPARRS